MKKLLLVGVLLLICGCASTPPEILEGLQVTHENVHYMNAQLDYAVENQGNMDIEAAVPGGGVHGCMMFEEDKRIEAHREHLRTLGKATEVLISNMIELAEKTQ